MLFNHADELKSISTIRGDLSNITAPPFVLDTKSVVELPAFLAERPSVFIAPAAIEDPARRALAVLKWFIASLRNQQYAGHEPEEGVKKPLNSFLGEVFLARWEDEAGTTRLVSEQVSHHPPVTACRVWNHDHGVVAEGFTRQEMTFSGSVHLQQIGYATLRLSKHGETYLMPIPNVKIRGILSGVLHPEIEGTYYIPSTNGYTSSIEFSRKGLFGSSEKQHSFNAKLYREGVEDKPLFTLSGHWDSEFTIHDVEKGQDIETFNIVTAKTSSLMTDPLDEQDPWETRSAWRGVREALEKGDMQGAGDAKSALENGQRDMRKQEDSGDGDSWPRIFFRDSGEDPVAVELASKIGESINPSDTLGIWRFNLDAWEKGIQKPYHGDLRPDNSRTTKSDLNGEMNGNAVTGRVHPDPGVSPQTIQLEEEAASEQVESHANHIKPSPNAEQSAEQQTDTEKGVDAMSMREQTAVEEMLRDQYSSRSKAKAR